VQHQSQQRSVGSRGSGSGTGAALEAQVTLLQQQLAQLTSDFKHNLRLLEDRDAELEKIEALMGAMRETLAARDLVS